MASKRAEVLCRTWTELAADAAPTAGVARKVMEEAEEVEVWREEGEG